MFCPNCGLQENHSNQFCRACGSNLNVVRSVVERPDSITASAVLARDEIGRAIAFKIREAKSAGELATIAEEALPEIEKFLESPEEKRLRRLRNGTMVASIGLGTAVGFCDSRRFDARCRHFFRRRTWHCNFIYRAEFDFQRLAF